MNDRTIVQHPNGYSGVLMGKSTMMIYDKDDNCIVHTCFRTPNTEKELYEVLETMPRFIEILASVEADRKTENSSEKPNNWEDLQDWKDRMWAEAIVTEPTTEDCSMVDKDINVRSNDEPQKKEVEWVYNKREKLWYPYSNGELLFKDEPQMERIKTPDYCDICNHKGCGNCIANNLDDYCVPSGYEPITQMKTQNSNLTFEKDDERCKGCKHYKLTCDLFSEICKFEPKDEPQTGEHCNTCRHKDECEGATYEYKNTEWWCLAYAPIKDEPQTK